MLQPTTKTLRPAREHPRPGGYFLSDVNLDLPSSDTAVFKARLHGPPGATVWVRAWLSNELDGTLAEVASAPLSAGDLATLTVKLHDSRIPEIACIRIESAPLATEQVVIIKLPVDEG
jgi:hypothetical protein